MRKRLQISFCLFLIASILPNLAAEDWPMWRHDATRAAASSEELPDKLTLQWVRSFGERRQAWDDPLNHDLMTYDRILEPVVAKGRMFIGFNDRDKVSAYDTQTGAELWSHFVGGPVRLPPAVWNDRVYFCSDDGYLYCVDATTGKRHWRFRGGPTGQLAIGNHRLVSAWPARGGPVIRDGKVYFAASIWPFMGTFLYALDAESGQVEWVNDSSGAQYLKQPHSAPSFAGVAPQGSLVATKDLLIVPGGRSVPAAFDRSTGTLKYFKINDGGKGTGGSVVMANDDYFFVHTRHKGTRAFHTSTGIKTSFTPNEPVLHNGNVYNAETDDDGPFIRGFTDEHKAKWSVRADGTGDLILSGNHLYAAGKDAITVIELLNETGKAKTVRSIPTQEGIQRLLSANGQLFAVASNGNVMAFGAPRKKEANRIPIDEPVPLTHDKNSKEISDRLLSRGDDEGYALWYGSAENSIAHAMATQSPFTQFTIIDEEGDRAAKIQNQFDRAQLPSLVAVQNSTISEFKPPRYTANMIFVDEGLSQAADQRTLKSLYDSTRPYGGVIQFLLPKDGKQLVERIQSLKLEGAEIEETEDGVLLRRAGALAGAADWTHQYGNIANTVKSDDERVKLPLGILWFGGSSNMDVLPRHGHGPPEQVVGGRLYIQGMNSLSCRDVYTGRVLWKREFENLGTYDIYYDVTYEDTPLDTKYNQVHIPGANGRGTNYVVTEDKVYIIEGDTCLVLDPASGEPLNKITLPLSPSGKKEAWAYLGVYKDVLIGGLGFANYKERKSLKIESDKKLSSKRIGFGSKSLDKAACMALVGFDRHSGELLWQVDARHSFLHNGIVAGNGQIICLDKNPQTIEDTLKRRGLASPDTYRVLAIDHLTGSKKWESSDRTFGTWLGYSEEKDLVLQAGAAGSDRLWSEVPAGMAVFNGKDGSLKWEKPDLKYAGPCIIHNDLIITNANSYQVSAGAFNIETGEQVMKPNPLTGEMEPWKITRAYGCNNIVASENLLTFRSGAAGFYDLKTHSGTGNFGGFKSGCTSNLIAANGVLNAPDYTRTCSCAYQNQTSLALVHMPELDIWTIHSSASLASSDTEIRQLGINFGAPGDRSDENGMLWLEYPSVTGDTSPISIQFNPEAEFYQRHPSTMFNHELPWVLASGISNVTDIQISRRTKNRFTLESGLPVNHPEDDAEEENESGKVSLKSSDLELIEESEAQTIGMRFNEIQIPHGATVKNAYIQFTCDEPSKRETSLTIAAEDTGNAERFTAERHDVTSRSLTSKDVTWQPDPWKKKGEAKEAQRTPDLSRLIQEVIDRDDWKAGNSLAFVISGTGRRIASASSGVDDANAPRLVIDSDEIKMKDGKTKPSPVSMTLYFGSPPELESRSVFDVYLQGERVISDLTIDPNSKDRNAAIHRFENILISDVFNIRLEAKEGTAFISGIELRREG